LYSQDHAAVDGLLNIFGDFTIGTTSEHWSYATDFDGATLVGGARRAVGVRFNSNATTTMEGGSLSIIGAAGATTSIANNSGTHAMLISGGTFNAQFFSWDDLSLQGLQFINQPTITDISDGYFELASDTGSLISVASSSLNANASKQFNRLGFNAVGPMSGFNIALDGVTTNAWQINDSYGNIGGEGFDIDGLDACGAIRFDDSECLL
jgi:hypothetical protein